MDEHRVRCRLEDANGVEGLCEVVVVDSESERKRERDEGGGGGRRCYSV